MSRWRGISLSVLCVLVMAACMEVEIPAIQDPNAGGNSGNGDVMWRVCNSGASYFEEMKTGDSCDLEPRVCDKIYDEGPLWRRAVSCQNDVLIVTEIWRHDEPEPREDAYWDDCTAAIDDARSGEACTYDMKKCFVATPDNCLERLACGGDDGIERYSVCDAPGSQDASTSTVHTDCETGWDALPGDACEGAFLCGMSTTVANGEVVNAPPETAPETEGQNGYGPTYDSEYMAWCNEGSIVIVQLWQII
ncbi:MAG: hypothetical protein GY847_30350 [Proteobacteria bacterium]|nr:hypothetical protein [Pseudomonadota bacterium]